LGFAPRWTVAGAPSLVRKRFKGAGLDKGGVHRKVLIVQQPRNRLLQDRLEEGGGHLRGVGAPPALGESGVVSDPVVHGHAHEPAKQEIVIQLLHEQEIAADGATHLEEQGQEQLLRRDGATTFREVHGLEVREELPQGLVHHQ
jgi:hypothetical protein